MTNYLPVFSSPQTESEVKKAYQDVLAHWQVPYQEIDISTSLGETHVIASGPESAPPLVLLHAYFATAASWYRNAAGLSQAYRTYAVDVMGEANLSRPTHPIRSLDGFTTWFKELIDGLGISETYLAGNSFGGFTAAYYAMRLPERIKKLVLIGPATTIHPMPAFYTHMFIPKALYLFFPWLPGRQRAMRNSVNWVHAGLPRDGVWDKLFELVMLYGGATNQVFPRVYKKVEFDLIKAPTLLILGDREKIYPVDKASQAAKSLMPGIQIETIPNAHHITALAQPELVNAAMMRFFQER